MVWLSGINRLNDQRIPFCIVTIAKVRGHAPRGAGSKMLVTAGETHGSVGGGNLEQTAVEGARALLTNHAKAPDLLTVTLNPQGGDHGVQCCGGEVTLLLEPVYPQKPHVAIFGAGHVGWALAGVLNALPVTLYLIDSRPAQLDKARLPVGQAEVRLEHAAVPETALPSLPPGAHVLIMTHDHAEDIAILDSVLRRDDWGFVGLIGSKTKWRHFQGELKKQGFIDADLSRVTTPIGLPGVPGKSPQAIAISVAAQLLKVLDLPDTSF